MSNPLLEGSPGAPGDLGFRNIVSRKLRERFDLNDDAAYEGMTLENVRAGIKFKGANLWILMLAILICSIGLNVNSTAVIIGAMLISPLMGPILGVGCGMAISDFDLLVASAKNLGIATLAAVVVSALYFFASPLEDAQSELLARTAPTLFDVLIATFGGFVGIIALSRREKSNAIPGVAIATALMPPICTAGYSIATYQWKFLAGSLYLYFINLTFIAFATFVLVRFMRFTQHSFVDEVSEKRSKRWIYAVVALVAIPSFYTAYSTVQGSVLERRVASFVREQFDIPGTQVIGQKLVGFGDSDGPKLTVMLLGKPIAETEVEERRERMREYALDGIELDVVQSSDLSDEDLQSTSDMSSTVDFAALYRQTQTQLTQQQKTVTQLRKQLAGFELDSATMARLTAESRALYPDVKEVSLGHFNRSDTASATPEWVVRLRAEAPLSATDLNRYGQWIKTRQNLPSVLVVQ